MTVSYNVHHRFVVDTTDFGRFTSIYMFKEGPDGVYLVTPIGEGSYKEELLPDGQAATFEQALLSISALDLEALTLALLEHVRKTNPAFARDQATSEALEATKEALKVERDRIDRVLATLT